MMMKDEQHLVLNATNALSLSSEKQGLVRKISSWLFAIYTTCWKHTAWRVLRVN